MSKLIGTFDIKAPERPVPWAQVFLVALYSYLLHQTLQEDVDVLRGDAGLLNFLNSNHNLN